MLLFGFGDGGGGPDMAMLERLRRVKDVDGLPKTSIASPLEFFDSVAKNEMRDLPVWVGELVRCFYGYLWEHITLFIY